MIVLELRYTSNPSGGKVTIGNAIYSNGNVIGTKQFSNGRVIKDRQVIYEHIKLSSNEGITATISFPESGVGDAIYSVKSNSVIRKSTDTPIGTIVSSVLNYNQFLELNSLKFQGDINKTIWVPCDGRNIGTKLGTYGAYSGGTVPDLRGLFIRGANNMGNMDATVPNAINENLNPDNTAVGKVQMDDFKKHNHKLVNTVGPNRATNNVQSGGGWSFWKGNTRTTTDTGGIETRPKSMTLYYYIKIK